MVKLAAVEMKLKVRPGTQMEGRQGEMTSLASNVFHERTGCNDVTAALKLQMDSDTDTKSVTEGEWPGEEHSDRSNLMCKPVGGTM